MSTNIKELCVNAHYRELFKRTKKCYTLQCQNEFLAECTYRKIIPKGISGQCKFTLSTDKPDLKVLLNGMFQFTKSRALDLIILDNEQNLKGLKHSIQAQIAFLNELYDSTDIQLLVADFNRYFVLINEDYYR